MSSSPLSKYVKFVSDKVNAKDITIEEYISTENMLIDKGGVQKASKLPSSARFHKFTIGDTLFSNIRTYFKKVWHANFDGGASPDVLIFRTKDSEILNPDYLYYLLSNNKFIDHTIATSKGAKMPRGDKVAIMQFEVELPSINEQLKTVKILKSLDKKIEVNKQQIRTLESIAQSIFKSWFVDFEPVKSKIEVLSKGGSRKDAELAAMTNVSAKTLEQLEELKLQNPKSYNQIKQTAELFPSTMQDSELDEIPKGWKYKKLETLCRVINGRAYKNTEFKESGTPIIRIQNLSNKGKTVYSDLDLPEDKLVDKEDFIYAWSATFGPFIWRGDKSIYHYHIWKMEVDETVISRYFLYLSMFRKTEAMKNAGTGSIFTHLTKGIMESQDILIADDAINNEFAKTVDNIYKLITSNHTENKKLSETRETLLPKLLKGLLPLNGVEL